MSTNSLALTIFGSVKDECGLIGSRTSVYIFLANKTIGNYSIISTNSLGNFIFNVALIGYYDWVCIATQFNEVTDSTHCEQINKNIDKNIINFGEVSVVTQKHCCNTDLHLIDHTYEYHNNLNQVYNYFTTQWIVILAILIIFGIIVIIGSILVLYLRFFHTTNNNALYHSHYQR